MPLPISRKFNVVEVDRHHEVNILKAELRATGVQVNNRDEERQRRIELLLVMLAVAFVIGKLGIFTGLLLTTFCSAMFCIIYVDSFLRFTGGTGVPIPLGERLDTAIIRIKEWIRLMLNALRAREN